MKTKHRRLSAQNNLKTELFFLLSTINREYLALFYIKKRIALTVILITFASHAATETSLQQSVVSAVHESLVDSLVQTIPSATPSDIEIVIGDINSVISGRQCDGALNVTTQGTRLLGRVTTQIQCDSPRWSFFLPVESRVLLPIVVTSVPITRGTMLTLEHVQLQTLDIGQQRQGYFLSTDEVLGHEARRTLQPGVVINAYIAQAPALVERGEWITIQSGGSAVVVTASGQALDSGGLGEQIRVKNLTSGQTIRAWITDKGVVSTRRTN